jgi:hypothetical protein
MYKVEVRNEMLKESELLCRSNTALDCCRLNGELEKTEQLYASCSALEGRTVLRMFFQLWVKAPKARLDSPF